MISSPLSRAVRRAVTAVACLAVASLAISGCSFVDEQSPAPTRAPASTEGIDDALRPFYEQELTWRECGEGFDCTTVAAPLDWSAPDAGELSLSVIRHVADGDARGSLLTNPGGPGASGVGLVRDSLSFAVGEPLQGAYDVIGFDPRGVGESTAVTCYDGAGMDAYLFDVPAAARGTEEWVAEVTRANEEFAAACDANSDGLLPYITTENAARDMDLLRGVLGDDRLNYLGYSYGTFLGAVYAKLYPERVGRLVLDGAIDPSASLLDVNVAQAEGFENSLRAFMQWCLTTSDECAFTGTVDDAMADLGVLMAAVARDPLVNADGRMLGASSLLTGIIAALYSQGSWPALASALDLALQGNAAGAFQLADFYYNRSADGRYLDNSTEAFSAYNCMDYPQPDSDAQIVQAQEELAAVAPTVAPYWLGPDLCASWPYPATGVREEIAADGAAPIVVVGSTGDPATPYEWSVALADQLASGVLITRVGEGHTGYNKGNDCVDSAVEGYLLDDAVPDDGLTCE